uniref:Si:ch73-335m24.2 n=1 Tax=Cyprinodon variegatus TaxID=28743 RepID=A0A3Q2DS17_CYPVA
MLQDLYKSFLKEMLTLIIFSMMLSHHMWLSVYLHSILKNHTAHACDGDLLVIKCPARTSVAVLSAFYGRRVPYKHLCPAASINDTVEEDTDCTSSTALEKVLSECQDERTCHLPVLAQVFGPDPCPLTTKYLLVSYKCRPENIHRKW